MSSDHTKAIGEQPSDDMVVLAMLLEGSEWRCAEDIASTLRRLGFRSLKPQKSVGQLRRLLREDSPMIESRQRAYLNEYRVTRFGRTQIGNHYPRTWRLDGP